VNRLRNAVLAVVAAGVACGMTCAPASAQTEPGWKVQGNVTGMGGQYFYDKSAGALNGFGDADVQLLRSYSTSRGFYVDAHTTYTGFKQVDELAGGGTLFQQSWDNSLEGKFIQRYDDGWSLKPRLAVHSELYRETVDETWGGGLYDFARGEGGLCLEHRTRLGLSTPWTWQLSWDVYYTHYPHFQTLTSQFGTEQSAPNPGSRILDTVANQFTYRSDFDLPGFAAAWLQYSVSFISFTDQKVVNSQDQFLSTNRTDAFQSLDLGYSKRLNDWLRLGRVRPVAALDWTTSDLLSNQNDFDADPSRLKFVGAYYDYWETHLSPSLTASFLKTGSVLRVGADFGTRYYTGRLAQNGDGSYRGDKLHQYTEAVTLDFSQPLWRRLDFRARAAWENTSANTYYEQTYTYNYHDYNYFAGLGWRF
jgi:hypothetical protein